MSNRFVITLPLLLILSVVLVACGGTTTTGSNTDANSASAYLPTLSGYSVTEAETLTAALSAVADQGADLLGNPVVAAAVERIDDFIGCYQSVGAVSANIYTKADITTLLSGSVPSVGAVAVINRDRVADNLVACAAASVDEVSAQSVSVCTNSGSFVKNGDTFTYILAGTSEEFCNTVNSHFAGIQ